MAETFRIEICPDAPAAARRKIVLEGLGFDIEVVEESGMTILGKVSDGGNTVDESVVGAGAHWLVVAKQV